MKHPTQSEHHTARLARLHASLHSGGERHDEGAGAIAWGCLSFLGWAIIGLIFLARGVWR